MRLALSLAGRGLGNTYPNPTVGCVLTRPDLGDRIVGRGWTQPGGRPHAETVALTQAGDLATGATAYVTFEPCCHTGVTPPCADALIEAGIARAVIATRDPDTRVSGQGIEKLRSADIDVSLGVLETEAQNVNRGFLLRQEYNRPFFTLKLAVTVDGRIATRSGESQWITSAGARAMGHALRARHDAILTGIGTAKADDPAMTCRLPGLDAHSPVRVVLDARGELDPASVLATTADAIPTWLIHADGAIARGLPDAVVRLAVANDAEGRLQPEAVAALLADRGINRVLIEAGAGVATSFLAAGLVDEIRCFRGPVVIGGDGLGVLSALGVDRLADAPHFRLVGHREIDGDVVEYYAREHQE